VKATTKSKKLPAQETDSFILKAEPFQMRVKNIKSSISLQLNAL
jgi:hypothetical protein